jgi:hypothetical protein
MKAKDIRVGGEYVAKVSNRLTVVVVTGMRDNYNGRTVYDVINVRTGRRLWFSSAAKFQKPAGELRLAAEDN